MKHKALFVILSVCMALFISNIAFADIDLDLGDEPSPSAGYGKSSYVTLKAGFDMMGDGEIDVEHTYYYPDYDYSESESISDSGDIKNGFSFSFEAAGAVTPMVFLGAGASYQIERGIDETDAEDLKFNFLPVYGLVKAMFDTGGGISPFAVFHIGWGFMFANDDFKDYFGEDQSGGLYWGIGGGIMFSNGLQLELLYSVNRGKSSESASGYDYYGYYVEYDYEAEIVYSKVTISAGFNF